MSAIHYPLQDGIAIIGGDLHVWPGAEYPGFWAMWRFVKRMQPAVVVLNGDVIHGARISRHARIGWEKQPMVQEELAEAQTLLAQLTKVAGQANRVWTLGNHDARFETEIANKLPAYERVKGLHLKDHFPDWTPAWAVHIGGPEGLVVKHRMHCGVNAARNNVLKAGVSICTGHTHQLGVYQLTDYSGTKYGIEHGMLADPNGPQFMDWMEDNPRNWRMGFVVATFRQGRLLLPEVAHVRLDGVLEWRGEEL